MPQTAAVSSSHLGSLATPEPPPARNCSRRNLFCCWLVITLFACLSASSAWARSYQIAKYNSLIHVDDDGSARISEQITFVFRGAYNGIYRDIPLDYPGPDGSNYSLFAKVNKVTDENGSPLKYEKSTRGGFLKLKIYVPGASDATRTVDIEYSVLNATKFFDDHDEFYWNVTGNDWPVPIASATATVFLPTNTSGSLRAQAFYGFYGSSDKANASVDGPVATFSTPGPL
ncbi:MAG: DUF2207 domain-containing protein, partial [Candidatus Angelobacter sp.]